MGAVWVWGGFRGWDCPRSSRDLSAFFQGEKGDPGERVCTGGAAKEELGEGVSFIPQERNPCTAPHVARGTGQRPQTRLGHGGAASHTACVTSRCTAHTSTHQHTPVHAPCPCPPPLVGSNRAPLSAHPGVLLRGTRVQTGPPPLPRHRQPVQLLGAHQRVPNGESWGGSQLGRRGGSWRPASIFSLFFLQPSKEETEVYGAIIPHVRARACATGVSCSCPPKGSPKTPQPHLRRVLEVPLGSLVPPAPPAPQEPQVSSTST